MPPAKNGAYVGQQQRRQQVAAGLVGDRAEHRPQRGEREHPAAGHADQHQQRDEQVEAGLVPERPVDAADAVRPERLLHHRQVEHGVGRRAVPPKNSAYAGQSTNEMATLSTTETQ